MSNNRESLPVIVGLGSTGISCARYFLARGDRFKVVDSRQSPPELAALRAIAPNVEVELGKFSVRTLTNAAQLVVSPGVTLKTPAIQTAIKAGVPVTGDIDIFSKAVTQPIVAVTGSNGKSTVVAILAEILRASGKAYGLGGNLDGSNFKPALDLLQEDEKDFYVLELSSFQLETTENLGAEVAVLLNLSEDHMDLYTDIGEYHRAKQRIFNGCRQVVVNRNDPYSAPSSQIDAQVWEFGYSRPAAQGLGLLEEDGDQYIAYQFEKIVSVNDLKIFGRHNVTNALAAATIAMALDIELAAIKSGLQTFSGLPHRCQWVADINSVSFYNDSKGTNVGATCAAIQGLGEHISGHIILIAGGVGKGADFSSLNPVVNRWGKEVILIGQDALQVSAILDKDIATYFAADLSDAVNVALQHAMPGDAVLLSPACASFDQFDNFQHRGQVFIQAVEALQ